jgi:hypothetical protein
MLVSPYSSCGIVPCAASSGQVGRHSFRSRELEPPQASGDTATIAVVTVFGDFETELQPAECQGAGAFSPQQKHFSHGFCLQV